LLTLLVLVPFAPAQSHAEESFSSDLSVYFTSGDYGTGVTTDMVSTTLFLGYYPNKHIDFGVSAAYLFRSNTSTLTTGGISFGPRNPRFRPGGSTGTTEETDWDSGIGDTVVSANLHLLRETENRPRFTFVGKIKLPTADEDKGFGTGKYDYTAGFETSKWLQRWKIRAAVSHVFQGDNDLFQLEDYTYYEAGIGYLLQQDLVGEVSYWGATELAEGVGSLAELRYRLTKWNHDDSGISIYGAFGLEDNSPDFGIGGSLFFFF